MPKRNLEPLPSPPLKRKRRILHSYYCSAMRMFDVEGYPMSARSTQKSFAKTCMISQALFFVTKNINFIWLNIQRVCAWHERPRLRHWCVLISPSCASYRFAILACMMFCIIRRLRRIVFVYNSILIRFLLFQRLWFVIFFVHLLP